VSDPLRIFLVGMTPDDVAALRARFAGVPLEIVGSALLADVRAGVVRIPEPVDAVVMPPGVAVGVSRPPVSEDADTPLVEHLTPRERSVLALAADGLPNRRIAADLEISEHTVKFHLASIFGKLGVSSRTEAVRRGLQLGLIDI
jgi:DNA-binding NarL/FixJ family response regulator